MRSLERGDHEFKSEFSGSAREWIEIIKDIVPVLVLGGIGILLGRILLRWEQR